jgi:hypothetical protein
MDVTIVKAIYRLVSRDAWSVVTDMMQLCDMRGGDRINRSGQGIIERHSPPP